MEKTEFELALQERDDMRRALASGDVASALDDDVILSTAVESDVDLGDATRFSEVRFRLSGVDLSGFELDGDRQTLRGDTLIVRRESWDAIDPGYDLPYKRMDMAEHLAPEPLIQSDDPRIVRRARSITAARADWSLDPKRVAAQLTNSVYNSLEKEVTISVPSAIQVLEAGRGDCNEHTVLYVALARALGLPARTAVGLVYVNGAFFYHAWPEVWMGDTWVAVDPTFGDYPADAAHIRFITGGLAQQVEIVRLIGRLSIEVLDAVPAEGA
jgi:transglutaminase-like putative cysteine protease